MFSRASSDASLVEKCYFLDVCSSNGVWALCDFRITFSCSVRFISGTAEK
jgi:hypothetical protein